MASEAATQTDTKSPMDSLREAFLKALELPAETDVATLRIGESQQWDSLGHMALVAELEERFGIALDTDDLVAMSSFAESVEILRRYGVQL